MLPPDARAVLTDLLRPPPGSTLDRAVALTYTLDLNSAMVAPLAFAGHVLRESSDPIAVMEAVRGCADRVDVFCQAGQVAVPQRGTDLLTFLEPVVHPVRRPRTGHLFHPKLWALRFRAEHTGDDQLRLLVLSRNLSAELTNWDVCLRLDGAPGDEPSAANEALSYLLRHTLDLCVAPLSEERRRGVVELAELLHRADWDLPREVRELTFHALGFPEESRPDFAGSRHLVISPFCNKDGLQLTLPNGDGTVVGEQEELDRLPDGLLDGCDVFVVNQLAGIPSDEAGSDQQILTSLHAKLYIVEQGSVARVLLGSANATDAAFGGNVELLAELAGKRIDLGIDTMIGAEAEFANILEPYGRRPAIDEDEDAKLLADLIRDLAAVPFTATVEQADNTFTLQLTSERALPATTDGVRVTAELVTRHGEAAVLTPDARVDCTFGGLKLVDVTPFVVLSAHDKSTDGRASTVVHAQLVGDPAGRFDAVIARQVDTPDKFLRFLELLLGLAGGTLPFDYSEGSGGKSWVSAGGWGVLELLLRALAERPTQLDDLARLVERLELTEEGQRVLPEGFTELWSVVDSVRRDMRTKVAS